MKKILIVEDDNTINNLIREILEKERYKIILVHIQEQKH